MANWREIVAACSEEKIYWEQYHYRFRKIGENLYELSRLVAGSCGEFLYHPKITVAVENELFVPLAYFDNQETPVKQLRREDDESFLDQEFVTLLKSYLQAKEQ